MDAAKRPEVLCQRMLDNTPCRACLSRRLRHSVPARADVALVANRAASCSCPMRECGAVRQIRSVAVRNSWSDPASALGGSDFSIREDWWWSQGKEKWLICYPSPPALALIDHRRPYGRPWQGLGDIFREQRTGGVFVPPANQIAQWTRRLPAENGQSRCHAFPRAP